MKITHVCKVWYPRITGVTVHVDCLARKMADAGHEVNVVTYDLSDSLTEHVNKHNTENYCVFRVCPGNKTLMRKVILKTEPDVIHAHGIWEHVFPSFQAAQLFDARFYITAHGTWQFLYSTPGMERFQRRLYYRLYSHTLWRYMVQKTNAMIALNAIEEKAHRALGAKHVARIPNGVDCLAFSPDHCDIPFPKFNLPDQYLFFAGAIQTQKGIFTLLEALLKVKQKGLDPTLVVAGEGRDLGKAKEIAVKQGLNVVFLGRVERHQMPGLMAGAVIFILPSEDEPFATVYLEAMASGTSCIGTNTGGTPEIIEQGVTGFLVPVNGAVDLANFLKKILKDDPQIRQMGINARQKAVTCFDWSILAPRLLQVYCDYV